MGRKGRVSHGAAGWMAAIAVTKALGALYKIPLGNLLGSRGMAHFHVAYNVYNVVLLLTTAGMTVAVSRLTSAAAARGRYGQARRTVQTALFVMTAAGLLGGGILLLGAPFLAVALHDGAARGAIAMLAPAVCCVCTVSALRGGTQGLGDMGPTAVSQVLESVVKLTVGLLACAVLLRRGAAPETAAVGAIGGVTAGEAVCLFYMLRFLPGNTLPDGTDTPPSRRETLRQLLAIAGPITAGSAGMSVITLLDQSLALGTLQNHLGYTADAAAELYGQYTFALTLFVLPPALLSPLTAALIPQLAAARARNQREKAAALGRLTLRRVAAMAFPMGLGLSALAQPLLNLLYGRSPGTVAAAAEHLRILGPAAVCVCLMGAATGILQAAGRERIPLIALAVGGAVKLCANRLLVGNPALHIRGAAWSTLLCYAVMAAIDLLAASSVLGGLRWHRTLLPAAAAGAVMAIFAPSCYAFLCRALPAGPAVLAAVALCAAVYFALALSLGAVTGPELRGLLGPRAVFTP